MSNRRKTKKPRSASSRDDVLRILGGKRVSERKLPALPETAASSVHVVKVSLSGAQPPVWRRLELPSAITLDRLHDVMQWAFDWEGFHQHAFETAYGEFGSPSQRGPWPSGQGDESAVALAQVAGEEGAEIVYVYDFGDDWRHDIVVEKILPAAPGVAYPRCTGGHGDTTPDEDSGGIWAFNAERAEDADPAIGLDVDDFDPETMTDALAHLAKVIVPGS
jgi:Plasmid pRiA4b ORF-3-like protein